MSNPLIVDTPNDLGQDSAGFVGLDSVSSGFNGSGIFYDAASTVLDAKQGNWVSLGVDGAADALDLLGFLADPFGVLLSAPIGWIIEHIGFLKEALDIVAGDPDAVRNMAATWQNIAAALDKSAEDYHASAEALEQQFKGDAGDAYRRAATNYANAVKGAASHSRDAAKAFEVGGAIVGTVRGAIRDSIAQFAADELIEGLAALSLSVPTFGASVATWVTATVAQGASLAARNAAKVTKVVEEISSMISKAKSSATALENGGKQLTRDAGAAEHGAANAERGAKDGADGAKGAKPGEGTKPASKTPDETRAEAGTDYRKAKTSESHANDNLAAAQRRQHGADSELAAAQADLAAAHTPAMTAAANRRIAAAKAHQETYAQQAKHWQDEAAAAQREQKQALKEYRESLKNDEGPISEDTREKLDHAKEGAMQGKESANNYGENNEESEKTSDEIDDGSLVGSEGE